MILTHSGKKTISKFAILWHGFPLHVLVTRKNKENDLFLYVMRFMCFKLSMHDTKKFSHQPHQKNVCVRPNAITKRKLIVTIYSFGNIWLICSIYLSKNCSLLKLFPRQWQNMCFFWENRICAWGSIIKSFWIITRSLQIVPDILVHLPFFASVWFACKAQVCLYWENKKAYTYWYKTIIIIISSVGFHSWIDHMKLDENTESQNFCQGHMLCPSIFLSFCSHVTTCAICMHYNMYALPWYNLAPIPTRTQNLARLRLYIPLPKLTTSPLC
jgi:hypothetical protein